MRKRVVETEQDRHSIEELARRLRLHALRMVRAARSSHIGSAFSMAELLAVLYSGVLRTDAERPEWPDRDRLVLSKGHACTALYAVLAERGFFPLQWLDTFYQNGGRLMGHATHHGVPGVEVSTGALGHGLPIACGIALAAKRRGAGYRVFTILSDGECDEGSIWEAALMAPHHRLDNLVVIIDYNKIQSLGSVQEVLDLEPLGAKWKSFGWSVKEVDGHDVSTLARVLESVPFEPAKPSCIVAHTVKGKGVVFMEGRLLWHYRTPDDEEYRDALAELGGDQRERGTSR